MNNLHGYNDFKDKRTAQLNEEIETVVEEVEEEVINEEVEEEEEEEETETVNEGAQLFDNTWKVRSRVEIPVTLINAYKKKVQQETGEDLMKKWSEQELAEEITKYVVTSFLNIENLPVSLVTGAVAEPQAQVSQEMPTQTQVQPGSEPVQGEEQVEIQIEPSQGSQVQSSQEIAQTIPQAEQGI